MEQTSARSTGRRPVLGGVAVILAVIQGAGMWWLFNRLPSGHLGVLVVGQLFLIASAVAGVCGILCAIGSWISRERYRLLGIFACILIVLELGSLREYL